MCLLAEVLLTGALLVGVLPLGVFLVAEKEMVRAMTVFLEKTGKILPGLEILGEEALLLFGALLVLWYSWHPFSSADWTGGHLYLCFWSLSMHRCAGTTIRSCECSCNRYKNGIGKRILELP